MNKINIAVIVGSTRKDRFSRTAADWIAAELTKNESIEVSLLDLRDYSMPFFDADTSPMVKQEPFEHESVQKFTAEIDKADGFVFVTPEYNHGTSAVLKNALDWVYPEWNEKPAAFVGYGNAGGARAIEQLRQVVIELQMAPISAAVHIAGHDFFPVQFGGAPADEMFANYSDKADAMINQLLRWAQALKQMREG